MPREAIQKIIAAGNLAPSGDNTQPWSFVVENDAIDVYIDGEAKKDKPLVNFEKRPTYIAHGALLENMSIAADHYGYYADIELFPEKDDSDHTAHITFREDVADHGVNLFGVMDERATDRKKYSKKPLTKQEKNELMRVPSELGIHGEIKFVEDRESIDLLAKEASIYERLLFSHKELHRNLYRILRLTKREAEETRTGLYVKTLGLPLFDQLAMRFVLRSWTLTRVLRLFGMHYYAGYKGELRYRRAGAYGAIVLDAAYREDCIATGRILERVWLLATRQELSLHPAYAIFLLSAPVLRGIDVGYTRDEERLLLNAVRQVKETFHIKRGEHIMFMFRMGYGKEVQHRALRKDPKVTFI